MPLAYWTAHADAPVLEGAIGDLLRLRAQEAPDSLALVWNDASGEGRMTYGALLREAERTARFLLRHSRPGDRVAVWARNSIYWVLAEYGCALGGLILTPWNTAWTDHEVRHALALTEPAIVLAEADVRGVDLLARAETLAASSVVLPLADLRQWPKDDAALPDVGGEDPFLIQFTSGTTGRAKGALIDHRGALNGGFIRSYMSGATSDEVFLNVSPLHHVAGSIALVLGALTAGAAYALMQRFDAASYIAMMQDCGATRIGGVPTMLLSVLDHPTFPKGGFTLRGIGAGGAEVPPALIRRLAAAFGTDVLVGYGQSECALVCNSAAGDTPELVATTVGLPAPQNDLKIVDLATGQTIAVGELGEICVRSPAMMRGYWAMPEATAQAIDADGWLHTGDLGVMLESRHVSVKGRAREVIIRGGENIYPAEVEQALMDHPAVALAAVVGYPDERWGQQVGAAIRLVDGADVTGDALEEFARERISHYKIPKRWVFLDDFPMTASGKIRKIDLAPLFLTAGNAV